MQILEVVLGFLSALKIYDNPNFFNLQSAIITEKISFEALGEYICIKTK